MIFINLFLEFFKIGLFAIGGGMATIPFLQQLSLNTGWFPMELITDMIAISESTPGPIGINMATYVGYNIAGIAGGITATLGEILPAMIIVTLVSKSLEKFSNNRQIDNIFYGLRPAVTGLIAAAGFDVFKIAMLKASAAAPTLMSVISMISWGKIAYFIIIFILIKKLKKHPIVYIASSAAAGIALAPVFAL
ncbi:chromate transporter [[Clostridium] symbiosum]|uniref:chromate transporter n=1 Tax=Clostridium symbiosum TaxID=1512 RepID=UPI001D083813|nr:chromate transporter [[Clostridium] symbiosum]MCB6610680.1 chromate transporter [[Clostridium] symbiosum]MCB6931290.1 chromate transporter [[Clostridium] symbiosum]